MTENAASTVRPRVAFLSTGGTLAISVQDRLNLVDYAKTGCYIDGEELLRSVPEVGRFAEVEDVPVPRLRGATVTNNDWLELARLVQVTLDSGIAGVVIGHGTNALEEFAYFLHLTLKTRASVVIVGSMRPADALGSDGSLNLYYGVATAASAASRGMGVLVVMDGRIIGARDVTKWHTTGGGVIGSLGCLGYVAHDGRVSIYQESRRKHTTTSSFSIEGLQALPRVDVVVTHVGATGDLIDAAAASGAQGIVIAASGTDGFTDSQARAASRAAADGVAVCISTRVVEPSPWHSSGLEATWIHADNLNPWKARVLLTLALTQNRDQTAIQRLFDTH